MMIYLSFGPRRIARGVRDDTVPVTSVQIVAVKICEVQTRCSSFLKECTGTLPTG